MIKINSRIKSVMFSIVIFILAIFLVFKLTPWPAAMMIRYAFEKEAEKANQKLEKHVPDGVLEILDVQYDSKDNDAKLDVYYPSGNKGNLPVVVWVHGGGWISGNKTQPSNYFKILAARGYVVVSIDYSIAPENKYPLPVKQTMAALQFLQDHSAQFHINPNSVFMAGDSAGSHIATQVANIISNPQYSELMNIRPSIERSKLKGLLLYCGPYDAEQVNMQGVFGVFLKTVLWSYSGKKDFITDPDFKSASVINYVDKNFPPAFISAGNGDPLLIHSQLLEQKLKGLKVKTDPLFFQENLSPKLPHEYQFNLDVEEGKLALKKSVEFLEHNK